MDGVDRKKNSSANHTMRTIKPIEVSIRIHECTYTKMCDTLTEQQSIFRIASTPSVSRENELSFVLLSRS